MIKKTRNTLVNAKCPPDTPEGHFVPYGVFLYVATPVLAPTVEYLVTDIRYPVLIHFPIIVQRSEGAHYFHRVVGLVVLSMSVTEDTDTGDSGGSGVYIWEGGSGVAIIPAGGTDLYCHSDHPYNKW